MDDPVEPIVGVAGSADEDERSGTPQDVSGIRATQVHINARPPVRFLDLCMLGPRCPDRPDRFVTIRHETSESTR